MTKSGFFVFTIPFTEIESFVIHGSFGFWTNYFFNFIGRVIHLFIKFVPIPYRSGGMELLFITKGVIEIIFISEILAKFDLTRR